MRQWVSPTLILVAADLLALWASFKATASLRIALNRILSVDFTHQLVESLFPPLPLVILCWGGTLFMVGSYDLLKKRRFSRVVQNTAKSVAVAMCLQVVLTFFLSRQVYSRSVVLIFWAVSLIFLILSRRLGFALLARLKARRIGSEPVAVVGTGAMARLLADKLRADSEPRFHFVGYISDGRSTDDEIGALDDEHLGHVEKVERLINDLSLRRVFVANPARSTQESLELVMLCDRMEVGLERVPDLLGVMAERVRVTEIDGVPLLSFLPVRFTVWQEVVKRTVDVVGAGLGLLALSPLFAFVGAAIRLDSEGSVLFGQRRVGRGGKHFELFKFRSMYIDAEARRAALAVDNEADGHIFKIKNDPRVTRVGRVIRRLSLDELPQLWNVLVGEMSLVGPRPLPKDDVSDPDSPYAYWNSRRRSVRPGITGLWQVSGRSQLPFEEMVNLDLYYINNWSLWLDLQILVRTIPAVFRAEGAY